ncbi:MAG: integrase [Deltaproteobacteria bacterium RIFOXYD12_FULL_56_24]|nr:MAG: integrase [Deltaproteobacteria bacterium RIFOXYD12_FULL_56_24]
MAVIEKRGPYQWRVKIRKKGFTSQTKTFTDKKNAETWARKTESEMERGIFVCSSAAEQTTVAEILERYEREIFPRLADGGKRERFRLVLLKKQLGHLSVAALRSNHIATYRDQRQQKVSPQTVKHELGLLNRALKSAQIDGGIYLPHGLPTAQIRMPKLPSGRERRLHEGEEYSLIEAAVASKGKRIGDIILFALETAARRGEIATMRWEHINLKRRTWHISETKNDIPRTVPLSTKAVALLSAIPLRLDGTVWGIQEDSITQAFGRVCQRAGIKNMRFHDLRHEATSRFFEKGLNIMEVAAITGHKTLAMLKRYTHLRAEDLAEKLG